MDHVAYANLRLAEIAAAVGADIIPLTSGDALRGRWEMRFGGPMGSNRVVRAYEFVDSERVKVGQEDWQWKLIPGCRVCGWKGCSLPSISFIVPIAPIPSIPGLELGTFQEECLHIWKTADGGVVLANADASLIEILRKVPQVQTNKV
ncbi:MAG: hypothetical protein M3O30_01575 [Planctomycetota bacterium]|nr:hypothetical protein [Planctomycetota bacterium]